MSFQFLTYNVSGATATITLNRAEVYNALNEELTFELQEVLKEISRDSAVRVVVLTGAGKAFCSGQDLKDGGGQKKRSFIESLRKRYNPIILAIRHLPKPVICRLNGVAAGAGCSLALACDMIIASEDASLIEVFINIGLVPDSGSAYFLPRLVGMSKAFELASKGSRVNAAEASRLGLVSQVVAPGELDAAVNAQCDYFAKAPTKAIGLIKKMLNKSATATLEEMLEYEAYCQEVAGNTDDYHEGVSAFLEKRKPDFKGK